MGIFGCVSINVFHLMILTLVLMCMRTNNVEAQVKPPLPPDSEMETLHEIAAELGKKDWNFSENPCNNKSSWFTPSPPPNVELAINNSTVTCNCSFPNGECHIDGMSLSMNSLSESIPGYLGNITTLVYLSLENNLFSGTIPPELGKLVNLENLILSANYLTGEFPLALSNLSKLTELRISSNNFTGMMPNIFQSWKQLEKLEIQAGGFEGPIPPSLAILNNLKELRISDLHGESSKFPNFDLHANIYISQLRQRFRHKKGNEGKAQLKCHINVGIGLPRCLLYYCQMSKPMCLKLMISLSHAKHWLQSTGKQ